MAISTSEPEIWAALQVDLEPTEASPPEYEPVDRAFIATLIERAEERIKRFTGLDLVNGSIPPAIEAAITLDVMRNYFNRLDPSLPTEWDELIAPYRQWGFGGQPIEEGAE